MFEPENAQKIQMLAGYTVNNGTCIDLGNENRETKFQNGNTQVRFMRNAAGEFTSIALENEEANVYAYWSEGYDVTFMLNSEPQFAIMFMQATEDMGVCF